MFRNSLLSLPNIVKLSSTSLNYLQIRSTMSSPLVKIGTHDGVFHCDEALACWMLKILPEYANAEIIRTRDPDLLATCHTVVDVGAVYDHPKRRYDHHQKGFTSTLSSVRPDLGVEYNINLSSAGLIYAHYGESVIEQLAKNQHLPIDLENLKVIYKKIYKHFIAEIDAIDNGLPMCDSKQLYEIKTHLSARIKRLNPEWNSKGDVNMNDLFQKAMALVGEEFTYNLQYFTSVWYPGRKFVIEAIKSRFGVHKSGEILEFTERFPWKDHLFDLEAEMGLNGTFKYVIFNDKKDSWRVQAVPVDSGSFILRKPLLEAWRGIRDDLLSQMAGIDDCIFCHSNGFIGGNKTREGAIKMAIESLKQEPLNGN